MLPSNLDQSFPSSPPPRAFDIVAIGASLGGIEALRLLLSALPAGFPAPILIVQHLSPRFPSRLSEALDQHTALSVRRAAEGQTLRDGEVYIAPPDRHLVVNAQRTLSLLDGPRIQFSRPSLDPLFHSVARAFGSRSIGVVLTGANGDGADGLRAIKRTGGIVIAQDKTTSRSFRMPHAAIATGCVNFVLPLRAIAPALITFTMAQGAAGFFQVPVPYPILA
jgi:two-component system chemotaxis response regulator CheB